MKKLHLYSVILVLSIICLASCSEYSTKPGSVYMPDMAYSRAYEFYSDNPNYKNGITAQAPVKGTLARGVQAPDHIGEFDTSLAKAHVYDGQLKMSEVEEGGRLYNIHCGVCHGGNLDGNGPLYAGGAGKYPAAPANFKLEKYLNMPVGTMYHAIMYGKNLMGSYASQLDGKQRWMVLSYIKKVQSENGGSALTLSFNVSDAKPTAVGVDSTKKVAVLEVKKDMPSAVEAKKEATAVAPKKINKY